MMVLPRRAALLVAALLSTSGAVTLRASESGPPAADADDKPVQLSRRGRSKLGPMTMAVEGHTVSDVSKRWTGKVVFAIFTSKIPKYRDKLVAQIETWASRPAAEGRYIAVGGEDYPEEWLTNGTVLKSHCRDDMFGISCKEATLLAEGAARGAEWLLITGEDNFVNTRQVERVLASKDPDEKIAYGVVGCGRGSFCKESFEFNSHGGFCGGTGYIISRGALRAMLADGATKLHQVYDTASTPNDMTTSCVLRGHEVDLQNIPGMHGYPMFFFQSYYNMVHGRTFLTTHYITVRQMRWMHAMMEDMQDDVKARLKSEAFTHGCAWEMNQEHWQQEYNQCMRVNGGFM